MTVDLVILSLGRDPFSMMSHLVGALLSLVATFVLVRRARRNDMAGVGVGMYGLMMVTAFSASALFHFVDASSPRYELYNKLDHSAIFLMIAGTGTAIYGSLKARWTEHMTAALWAFSLLGLFLKLTFWSMPDWLTASIYLSLGWLGGVGVLAISRVLDRSVRLFLYGAVAFSVGAVVFSVEQPSLWTGVIGAHDIFHLLVLLGAAFHFGFIYRHCTSCALVNNRRSSELSQSMHWSDRDPFASPSVKDTPVHLTDSDRSSENGTLTEDRPASTRSE